MDSNDLTLDFPGKCINCKVKLRPIDKFCFNCGQQILAVKPLSHHQESDATNGVDQTIKLSPNEANEIEPGDLFAGKFRVLKRLGSGGMGVVYLSREEALGIKVALKILRPEFSRDASAISRFQREIRILARIHHPSIPRIMEWGNQAGIIFFATEFIEGRDLAEILIEHGPYSGSEAMNIMIAVAETLGHAHQAGVVHRDIKPSNIMISKDERIHLIDFGVARVQSAEITRLTESGLFIGTPQYMSPEQINSHYTDERSDIYSLGVVFYELLTGKLPFSGETPVAIASKHQRDPPTPPRAIAPSIPIDIERIVMRCLEKEPSSRYWTINEILTDIRRRHGVPRIRKRSLPNGDMIVEDPDQKRGAALEILSVHEKAGWGPMAAIFYRDQFYRLKAARAPEGANARWRYLLEFWPDNEVMPRVVDYESEAAIQCIKPSVFSRAKRWVNSRLYGP